MSLVSDSTGNLNTIIECHNTDNSNSITRFTAIFKECLNILRDNEGMIGNRALQTISQLLILKLIEPHIGKSIDMDNQTYVLSVDNAGQQTIYKTKLLAMTRFSNLVKEPIENINTIMFYLWSDILSVNPYTKDIFIEGRKFEITRALTYKCLFSKLSSIDLNTVDYDILGTAYEEIIKDIMIGKVFGQFFTPALVKNIMVDLINPQILPDGTIQTCCDPAMGTGGFLITYLRRIISQAKARNIKLNWDFILNNGIYGREIEHTTHQLAMSNILISSGQYFDNIKCGDSIKQPISEKFDIVLANPPFGIKGLDYDNINYDKSNVIKAEYIPIKTNNAVSLFIQAIIYMLNVNGRCAMVVPDGQDLFNKSKNSLISIRKYLLKTCELHEIIYLPSGIFTNTTIKTCIFYFTKKIECTNVVKYGRQYEFIDSHQTTNVKFYNQGALNDKELIITVPINKIINNHYSLNYLDYINDTNAIIKHMPYDVNILKYIGDICEIQHGKRIVKDRVPVGEYPVYGGGRIAYYTNTYSRDGRTCKISRSGMSLSSCVLILEGKYYLTDSGFTIKSISTTLLDEYLWIFLIINRQQVFDCGRGVAQKIIDINKFKSIQIPVLTIEQQKRLIDYYNEQIRKVDKIKQAVEISKTKLKNFANDVIIRKAAGLENTERS